jgi:hypothetical protein
VALAVVGVLAIGGGGFVALSQGGSDRAATPSGKPVTFSTTDESLVPTPATSAVADDVPEGCQANESGVFFCVGTRVDLPGGPPLPTVPTTLGPDIPQPPTPSFTAEFPGEVRHSTMTIGGLPVSMHDASNQLPGVDGQPVPLYYTVVEFGSDEVANPVSAPYEELAGKLAESYVGSTSAISHIDDRMTSNYDGNAVVYFATSGNARELARNLAIVGPNGAFIVTVLTPGTDSATLDVAFNRFADSFTING